LKKTSVKKNTTGFLQLHLAVLLFGGAGLFGKLIHLSAGAIVLGRAGLAALFLLGLKKAFKESYLVKTNWAMAQFVLLGILLAFHWVAFFQSIQLSTVAVGVLTFSTFPVFTTLLEPWFSSERLQLMDLGLAALAMLGVYLVLPADEISLDYWWGVVWGVLSGLSFAVLALLNKQLLKAYTSNAVSFYQNGIAALVLLPFFVGDLMTADYLDWGYLIILGVVFTGVAHTLFIHSMRYLKARTASLVASLEPVYGILLAWLLLGEMPTIRMLLGGCLILGVALVATLRKTPS